MGSTNSNVISPKTDIEESSHVDRSSMDEFLETLPSHNLEPLWSKMSAMVPQMPNPTAVPALWKYSEMYPQLQQAAKLVSEEQAERRVLMLVNPTMKSPNTTDTLYGGLQIVNPDETAPAHRHIAYACRFIIEGSGFTAVEGKKMPLVRGDVVITPSWNWHDHGNESDSPVIWLDILNLPLFTYAPVHFAEVYAEKRYPSKSTEDGEWRFPWADVQKQLDEDDKPHSVYHYKRTDGRPLSTTLTMQAERISEKASTGVSQDSSSFIYHIVEGSGKTYLETAAGEQRSFSWSTKDTFAIPAWTKIQHVNESLTPAYLVAANDGPFLDLLELRRP